ncbi:MULTISPECIES: acyl carrier protein [Streptomyces]|uniref:acyl carrier protein n=1 Tax=Streptomyces TaxID=1883 RepID=UPI0029A2E0CB|nr:acyl carrier protein [Streptomyces sp. WI03-4A]MDX2592991.1 acyl carrier protein [Streptomyces sp. WI03-4A]
MSSIEERAKKVIARELGCDMEELRNNRISLIYLGMDELARPGLVMALEEEFDAEITDEVGDSFAIVQDVIDAVTPSRH